MIEFLKSKTLHKAIGILSSVAVIGWMIAALEWGQVLEALKTIKTWPIIPSLILIAIHWYLRSLRWRYLLPETTEPPTIRTLFDCFMAGNFATFVLPLRAGEFVRPLLLSRQSTYPFSTAFVSIVVERFFDLVMVLLSFAILLYYMPSIPDWVCAGAISLGILSIIILAFLIIGVYLPNKLLALAKLFTSRAPSALQTKILGLTENLLHGLTILKSPKNLIWVTTLSILVWITCYLFYWIFLYYFDLPTSLWAGIAVAVVIALAVAAPSAPGFIGIYEVGCIAGLALFNVSKELAVAYALVSHAFQYILVVGYGAYLLTRYNLRLKELDAAPA